MSIQKTIIAAIFLFGGGTCLHGQERGVNRSDVLISEFMAVNDSIVAGPSRKYTDWIELYNFGSESASIHGLYLTDSRKQLTKWALPDQEIEAGGYFVIWAGEEKSEAILSFGLKAGGDFLALVASDGKTILQDFGKSYPEQKKNLSYGLSSSWKPGKPIASFWHFLEKPTPGKPNSASLLGIVKAVTLSHKRGFHTEPFDLKIETRTKGATIRYTTDGSAPNHDDGEIFGGELRVDHTMVLRIAAFKPGYQASSVKTHTYIFSQDVAYQSPEGLPPEGFPYMWGRNQVDYGMDPEIVSDPRFEDQFVEGLESLPAISLVAEQSDLFDSEKGIYSNAHGDGREWERPCSVEMFDSSGDDSWQVNAGLRIRGGFSRRPLNPKHAFRVFFRDVYGPSKLEKKLFPDGVAKRFDNIDLRTFQNYSWSYQRDPRATFLRDQFNRDLQLAMGQPAARGEYYHLFLNGQYWGIYNTCERPKASFGETYLGGKKEDYDSVKKGNTPGTRLNVMATDGNLDAWRELWEQAKAGLESDESYFKLLGQNPDGSRNKAYPVLLDPENLIDYMLIIFYGGNLDAPVTHWGRNASANNWHGIRNRKGDHGFQFFIWDAEHTFLHLDIDRTGPFPAGEEYSNSNPQYLWQQCLANEEFRMMVADRVHQRFFNGGLLSAPVIRKRFLARAVELETAVVCESARWGDVKDFFPMGPEANHDADGNPITRAFNQLDWQREVDRIANDYMVKRSEIVLAQLYSQGILPDLVPPTLNRFGGAVKRDFELEIEVPDSASRIYLTLDGSDPRMIGGEVSGRALRYKKPIALTQATRVMARSYLDGEWSALTKAQFDVR